MTKWRLIEDYFYGKHKTIMTYNAVVRNIPTPAEKVVIQVSTFLSAWVVTSTARIRQHMYDSIE